VLDTDKGKFRHEKWAFFTTNYENISEDFWVEARRCVGLDLGFELKYGKKIMNADKFLRGHELTQRDIKVAREWAASE
jgi:hypothetical protein